MAWQASWDKTRACSWHGCIIGFETLPEVLDRRAWSRCAARCS